MAARFSSKRKIWAGFLSTTATSLGASAEEGEAVFPARRDREDAFPFDVADPVDKKIGVFPAIRVLEPRTGLAADHGAPIHFRMKWLPVKPAVRVRIPVRRE